MRKIVSLLSFVFGAVGVFAQQIAVAEQVKSRYVGESPDVDQTIYVSSNSMGQVSSQGFLGIRSVALNEVKTTPNEVDVLVEDFSKMTDGAYGNPEWYVHLEKEESEYPWINQKDDYYNSPGWGGDNNFSAGGMVLLAGDLDYQYAHINTPLLDLSKYEQVVMISFKVRTDEGVVVENGMLEAAETNHMGPSWDILGGIRIPKITDQWQVVEAMFMGAGPTTLFNIVSGLGGTQDNPETGAFYVDDLRVYQVDAPVKMPKVLGHTNYQGNSFTLNWESVENAEYYLLNVYSVSSETGKPDYLLFDKRVETCSYEVTGAESGVEYFFTLRSAKGESVSFETFPSMVADLVRPEMNLSDGVKNGSFHASWTNVPGADRYNYLALYKREATENGEFVVTDEDFTGVTDAEGNLTGWVKEEPQASCYDQLFLTDLKQAGWSGTQYAPYTDYVCLDGWQYVNNGLPALLLSPELDLSKDGGKVKMSVKLCGTEYDLSNYQGPDGQPLTGMDVVDAAVVLYNYDAETDMYVQTEIYYDKKLSTDWKTCEFTFTKGSSRSKVGVMAVEPENLYIDDLKLTQYYQKGDMLLDPFCFKHFMAETEVEVSVPGQTYMHELFHKVNAVKTVSDLKGKSRLVESRYSDLQSIGLASTVGVDEAPQTQMLKVLMEGDCMVVMNNGCDPVVVYDVNGAQVYGNQNGDEVVRVSGLPSGIYVVKVGVNCVKVGF